MKKSIYLLIISAFLLAGCNNLPGTNSTTTKTDTSASMSITPSTTTTTATTTTATTATTTPTTVDPATPNTDALPNNPGPEGSDTTKPIPVGENPPALELSSDDQVRSEAVFKLDLAMCSKISTAQTKQSCELEVIVQKALTDTEYCKTLTDPNHQAICKGLKATGIVP